MRNEFEDLDDFTDNEFSTIGSVHNAKSNKAPSQLSGIFDRRSEPMFSYDGQQSEGRRITFLVQTSLTRDLHHEDQITIDGVNHRITGINPKNDGLLSELVLAETAFISPVTGDDLVESTASGQVVGENIAQYRLVYRLDDILYLADATDIEKIHAIGAMQQNVSSDSNGSIKYSGYIKNDSWNWDSNKELYLGQNGQIVQYPVASAVADVDVGRVLSPTEILLDIQDPIYL